MSLFTDLDLCEDTNHVNGSSRWQCFHWFFSITIFNDAVFKSQFL